MMRKFIVELLAFLILFFGTWFLLSHINFTDRMHVKQISKANETKLGNVILDYLKESNRSCDTGAVVKTLDSIRNRICIANKIDTSEIGIHVFYSPTVNAFAIPGNNLVVFTGIINLCNNPEELASVMAHEIAHIQKQHLAKKLTKEIGISILTMLAGGSNTGGQILKEVVRTISSTSFDREMESEADAYAVQYLTNAGIDPENFANLLFRLSKVNNMPENFEWISTHPNSKNRSAEILKLKKNKPFTAKALISNAAWQLVKTEVTLH